MVVLSRQRGTGPSVSQTQLKDKETRVMVPTWQLANHTTSQFPFPQDGDNTYLAPF